MLARSYISVFLNVEHVIIIQHIQLSLIQLYYVKVSIITLQKVSLPST